MSESKTKKAAEGVDEKTSAPKAAKKATPKASTKKETSEAKAAPETVPPSSPATEKPEPAKGSSKPKKKAASVDGVELARLRRLARAGVESPGLCKLLGVALDVGPRSNRWCRPVLLDDDMVSELAVAVVESGVSPEALEHAAAELRKRAAAAAEAEK